MSEDILNQYQYNQYHERNIKTVISFIADNDKNSEILPTKVQEWIEKQPTDESKQAAQDLYDNTKYYSHSDVFREIYNLIDNKYTKLVKQAKKSNKEIIMFIGKENKSNDYLSMIAYYHMLRLSLIVPSQYIRSIMDKFLDSKKYIIVYLDDMAYSGGQVSGMMNKITTTKLNEFIIDHLMEKYFKNDADKPKKNVLRRLYNKDQAEKGYTTFEERTVAWKKLVTELSEKHKDNLANSIHFLFIGVNKYSLERMNTRYYAPDTKNGYEHVYWMVGGTKLSTPNQAIDYNTLILSLDETLSGKRLFNIGYFFSFGVIPNVNVYFDHKIADDVSVFTRVLTLGPIVPKNYCIFNYLNPKNFTKKNLDNVIGNKDVFTKRFYDPMVLYYDDINIKESRTPQNIREPLEFHPFLNNCTGVQKIINHPYMKYINYLELINARSDTTFFLDDIFYTLDTSNDFLPKLDEVSKGGLDPPDNYRRRKIDETTYKKIENFLIRLREDRCHITMYKNNYKPKVDIESIEGWKDTIPESVYKSSSPESVYKSNSKTPKKSSPSSNSKTQKKKSTKKLK